MGKHCKIISIQRKLLTDGSFVNKLSSCGCKYLMVDTLPTATEINALVKQALTNSEILVIDTSEVTLRALATINIPYYCIYSGKPDTDIELKHLNLCRMSSGSVRIEVGLQQSIADAAIDYRPDLGVCVEL